MSAIQDNCDIVAQTKLLIFGDNQNDIELLRDTMKERGLDFSITLSIIKTELHGILSRHQHDFLIFLDSKRENNLNDIELHIKNVNPEIKLIFLDYYREQIFNEQKPDLLEEVVTKIQTWINILNEVNEQTAFLSIKLSPKNISEGEIILESNDNINNQDVLPQKDLRNALKRMNTIFDAVPEGIIILNMRGNITRVNKAYSELTGFTPEDILGKHVLSTGIIKKEEILNYAKILADMFRGKPVDSFEFKGYMKDGTEKIGEARSQIVNLGLFKKEIVVITHDVTDRYNREMKLQSTLKDLAQINGELDDFTYAVSHDLKAPLRTIKSFGSFLLEDYSDKIDEEGQMYLSRMMDATTRMKVLIEDLLTISRIGRMNVEDESVDFSDIINIIKLDLNSQLEESGGAIFVSDIPIITSKKILIKQLLFNLISNGLKYNESETPKIWISHYETPSEHTIKVRDNGIGIDKKHHDKIFKIFERLHKQEEFSGTGAGLTICKKIVENLGGRIWVESEIGKGSTFFFTIPNKKIDPLTTNIGDVLTIANTPHGDMIING